MNDILYAKTDGSARKLSYNDGSSRLSVQVTINMPGPRDQIDEKTRKQKAFATAKKLAQDFISEIEKLQKSNSQQS